MMRPFGGCNPEFGGEPRISLCPSYIYDLCVLCMCVIICLNDLCVPLMWRCARKPCVLSFKIVLWFTITLDYGTGCILYVICFWSIPNLYNVAILFLYFTSLKNKGKKCEAWFVLITNIIHWTVTTLWLKIRKWDFVGSCIMR